MSAPVETAISGEERAALAALGDVLIPAVDGRPAWSEAGPNGKWLDRALTARRLHAEQPEKFRAPATIVSAPTT